MQSHDVILALGSNIGNREEYINEAIKQISELEEVDLVSTSDIYETRPVGFLEQGDFLNMIIHIRTSLGPLILLHRLQSIEKTLKRKREIHWGPRTIDIDILLFGKKKINHEKLTVPHPRMRNRAFVLVPLKDIKDYSLDFDIDRLIENCEEKDGVKFYKKYI